MAISLAELEAKVVADTSDFDAKMDASGQKIDDLGAKAQAGSANFGAASAAMAAGAAAIGLGIADAVGMAGNFQVSMNEIGAVTGATASELEALSAVALQVGQDTAFSAQEGAQAISELGKAGIPIPDILGGAAMATADLAAAAGVDMPRAAEVMANSMNVFRLSGDQAANVADTLAAAANASASDVNSLAMGMTQAGPAAAGLGLSLQETVAQLALFSNYGMQGSDAGTSFKTMIASLTPSTKAAKEAFAELGLATAETSNVFFDANGNFVGMEEATRLLYDALAPLTDEQRLMAEETIFGSDASRAAEITFQAQKAAVEGTAAGYSELLAAVQPAGQATEVANAKMAGMNGALEALSGSIDTAKIAFGMAFLPAVEMAAEGLAQLVNVFISLPEPVQNVISFMTAGAAAFLAVGSAVGFVVGPMGAFLAAMAPLAAAIAAIAVPLALVAAGLAALYLAYTTDFMGFADGVNAAAALVGEGLSNLALLAQNVATAFGEGGLSAALGVLASAFQTAWSNISTAISSIDWGAVSAAVQTGLQQASDAITTWLGEQSTALQGAFSDVDWGAVGATILNGLLTAIAAVGAFNELLLTKGVELMQGLLTGITQKWPEVDSWLKNLATDIGATVGDLTQTLLAKGADLMGGLLQGITDRWPDVDSWLMNLATDASETVGSLLETLTQQGTDLISGLWTAAQAKWTEATAWLATLSSLVAASTLTDAATLLSTQGTAVIQGLLTAAQAKWTEAVTWLQGLAAAATAAVGDLSTALYQAGVDLIGGLVSGILSQAGAIADAIASVIPSDIGVDIGGINIGTPTLDFLGGGGGGGSSGGSSAKPATGGGGNRRAAGGPVWSGREYLVGEEGPELFIPDRSGTIIPNGGIPAALQGFAGQPVTYINQVVLRDERDMQNYVRQSQRSQRVMSGRGS